MPQLVSEYREYVHPRTGEKIRKRFLLREPVDGRASSPFEYRGGKAPTTRALQTIYHPVTGEPCVRRPVDARELIEAGYLSSPPNGGPPPIVTTPLEGKAISTHEVAGSLPAEAKRARGK